MPQIIPIKELKNTAKISEMCKNSNEPIFITKNGYGDMVIMSLEVYENLYETIRIATLLNEASDACDNGEEMIDSETFFNEMDKKYSK
ncbi:MAG: type II toxin-antitoxin system prevent-host-death family antitoxin [Bacillota bacterium]